MEGFYLDDLLEAWKAHNSHLSTQKAESHFSEAINRELALAWEEGRYAGASWATDISNPYTKKVE